MRGKKAAMIATVLLVGIFLAGAVGTASAHFTMVFPSDSEATVWDVTPEDYIAELGVTKTVYMMWGHPYEHILFDMGSIPAVSVMKPDGTVEELTTTEITVDGMDEEGNPGTFVAYKASFTVDQRGDSVVFVNYEDEDENLIDCTKAVIHCGVEMWEGWDAEVGQQTEILPYMRPYGMEEGFVFAGQAMYGGNPLPGAPVEIEIYHTLDLGKEIVETAEALYPYDPPMVFTRLAKSNENGEFVYTLDEPGIWFVGATMEPETGRNVRGVFIVPVIEEFPAEEEAVVSTTGLDELKNQIKALEEAVDVLKTPAGGAAPGFGLIAAMAGLSIVVYLVKRRKR
jgi:cobalt/nickel transport protein